MPKPSVLIITNRGDHTADWLVLELERRQAQFTRLNTEDFPARAHVSWHLPHTPRLTLADRVIDLSSLSGVWFRRPVAPRFSSELSPDRAEWVAKESQEVLEGLWRTLDVPWVNHPDANRRASSKIEQLHRARRFGFRTPETLVTNSPEELQAFVAARPSICKPLRSGRVIVDGREKLFFTSLLTPDVLAKSPTIGPEPFFIQEQVAKRYDLRVTVIGTDLFAVAIDSQTCAEAQVDWRRGPTASLRHQPTDLPAEVADMCLGITASYGLNFGAIDLALTPDGSYVFFELNANGQWAWLEQATGLPLRSRLADLLEGRSKGVE